ncbi:MAG: hypothetical protein LBJ31_02995 [Treponema sp.]|jgi:hypothetical protein|nr:hypothetical protein [Treponema sp.]
MAVVYHDHFNLSMAFIILLTNFSRTAQQDGCLRCFGSPNKGLRRKTMVGKMYRNEPWERGDQGEEAEPAGGEINRPVMRNTSKIF